MADRDTITITHQEEKYILHSSNEETSRNLKNFDVENGEESKFKKVG